MTTSRRPRGSVRRTSSLAVLVLVGAACTNGTAAHLQRPVTSPTVSTSSPARGLPEVPLRTGWPDAVAVQVRLGSHPGLSFTPEAPMGGRPTVLGTIRQDPLPKSTGQEVSLGGIGVGALDARTGTLELLHRYPSSHFQSTIPDSDGDWVVWAEDDSPGMSMANWTIWAHDLRSHRTHQVATRTLDAQGHGPSGATYDPVVSHGVVAWSASTSDGRVHAFTAPVAGGPVTDVMADAADAHLAWPYLAAIRSGDDGSLRSNTVVVEDLRDHRQRPVPGTTGVRTIALSSTTLVWIEGDAGRSVHVADIEGNDRRLLDTGRTPQFPSAGDGVVAWDGYDDGPMLVREGRPQLLNLVHQQTTVRAKGRYVLWRVRDEDTFTYWLLDVDSGH